MTTQLTTHFVEALRTTTNNNKQKGNLLAVLLNRYHFSAIRYEAGGWSRIIRYVDPHIGIRPTSVKRFSFFAGVKIWRGGRSHKQWIVGISLPPSWMQFFVYIYTKQCGLCGLPGYLSVLTIFCSLVSICCKMHCSLFKHHITRKTSQITRKRPKITRKHIAESRGG